MSKINNTLLEINNLFSVYDEKKEAQFVSLADINYKFDKNKIYCIIGNSGSGKSTLVTHFNGLLPTKYGTIKLQNRVLGHDWNLHNLLLGAFEDKDFLSKFENSFDEAFVFGSKVSSSKASLLVEAYYKTRIKKVKMVKYLDTDFHIALVSFQNAEYLKVLKKWNKDDLNNFKNEVINQPSLFKRIGLKKIKDIKKIRQEIGMVFQFPEYQLFKDTIEKDIMFGPMALGVSKEESQRRAKKYLNALGLDDSYLHRNPFGLSGGQKRRVAIAGILAIETPILIFDEPTAGLDPQGEEEMMSIIKQAKADGRTVFVITHTMEHVLEIADEVIVLNDGEIVKSGTPFEVFSDLELIKNTSITPPRIIRTINDLTKKDKKFKKILDFEPRTVKDLADGIEKILKGN